ncbi:LolA family outer membrane lipoprotein-sorting protein, partial [Idiomarina sp. UBA1919]
MIRLLLATTLLITSAMVVAGEDMTLKALSALEKQSEPLPLSLEFSQKKQLSGLPRPLVSSGQLDISKDEIVWTTEQPQQQQLTINRQGIFEQGNENSVSGSDTIAQLLLAILQQDE